MRPSLMVVEPAVNGVLEGHAGLHHDVALLLVSLLAEGRAVNVSGPLLRGRIAAAEESAAGIAGRLGYDFVVESEIRAAAPQCLVRMAITATKPRRPVTDFATSYAFEPWATASLAEAIASWMHGHIEAAFAAPAQRSV